MLTLGQIVDLLEHVDKARNGEIKGLDDPDDVVAPFLDDLPKIIAAVRAHAKPAHAKTTASWIAERMTADGTWVPITVRMIMGDGYPAIAAFESKATAQRFVRTHRTRGTMWRVVAYRRESPR